MALPKWYLKVVLNHIENSHFMKEHPYIFGLILITILILLYKDQVSLKYIIIHSFLAGWSIFEEMVNFKIGIKNRKKLT